MKRAKIEAKQEAAPDDGLGIYEGDYQLVIPSPADSEQVRQLEEQVRQVKDLKIVWTGGSVDEGAIIAVTVQKPLTLIQILNEMPIVEKVIDKKDEKIIVTLRTSNVS